MCGILGYWSKHDPISYPRFDQALQVLSHRGPDAKGIWIGDTKKIALANARLSIIDLVTGDQPLKSPTSEIYAVVNGEFYEFEKIRQNLKQKGYQFQTQSDSEILIALYQEYGVECLQYLRGEFAFILWDGEKRRLFAARDRFGIKPLFYTYYQDTLYLASEIKALLSLGVPSQWDITNLLAWENFLPLQERTLFNNIYAIKPGHYIIATEQQFRQHVYWDFNYPQTDESAEHLTEEEYIKELRRQLDEAVRIRLRADVPVGCYLSGGIDSSTVLALMAQHSQTPIDTFTISFNDALFDESAIAKDMCRWVKARDHILPVNEQLLSQYFTDALFHSETIIINNNSVAKFLLSKFTRDAGYKVVLTGEGSDEIFAGYLHFRDDVINDEAMHTNSKIIQQRIEDLHQADPSSRFFFPFDYSNPKLINIKKELGYLPAMLLTGLTSGSRLAELHTDEFAALTKNQLPGQNFINQLDLQQIKQRPTLSKSLYLWSKSILPGYILVQTSDRMEMAHSVEGRVPFLDHQLVEFAVKVPNSLKIKGTTEKYILREAMKDMIPETVYKRRKHPFRAPANSVNRNPFHDFMLEIFHSDLLKNNFFYDQKKVLNQFAHIQNGPVEQQPPYDRIWMHILSSCLLQKIFNMALPR